jgi:trans-AT polyketide synthase/acyltransferase/oxidoreductase domain-containing protein
MKAFMFPGQGSQSVGMGGALFAAFPEYVRKASEVLGYSIEELCLRDPAKKLGQTQYTQPAVYVVGVLSYLRRVEEKGDAPDWVLGHSVGEYAALFAAAAFDFETGLRVVKRRAELMAEARDGAMAAVVRRSEDDVRSTLASARLDDLDVANINSPQQIVLAGPRASIEAAKPHFEAGGARYVVLNVSGAFHSRYMADAAARFATFLEGCKLHDPRYPVLSNVDARPYQPGEIRRRLVEQIVKPVRWVESIRYLEGLGATEFEELGSGEILRSLVAQIRC